MDSMLFYFVSIIAVLLVGISKGGFGGGLGLLAVPLMSLAISPIAAAAILLPVLCVMDVFGVWKYRGNFDRSNLFVLLPAALLGILFGALSFHSLSESNIKLMTGLMSLLFSGHFFIGRLFGIATKRNKATLLGGIFWGALSGFSSFSVHAGGPALNIYLLSQKLNKTLFVGTTILFFTTVNYIKLIPYFWLGLFKFDNLMVSLLLALFAPLGVLCGAYLHKKINDKWFYFSCYFLLLVAGLKLTYEGMESFF